MPVKRRQCGYKKGGKRCSNEAFVAFKLSPAVLAKDSKKHKPVQMCVRHAHRLRLRWGGAVVPLSKASKL